MQDTETQFFVKNFIKKYPNKTKVVQYKNGFYKNKPDIQPVDHWLDPLQYADFIQRQKDRRKQAKVTKVQPVRQPMVIALPFDPVYQRFIDDINNHQQVDDVMARVERNKSLDSSRRRSKRNIVDIIACNDFDMFVTFSFGEDHYDISLSMKKMTKWIKNQQEIHQKKGYDRFQYIIIPEYHGDKKAIHYHAMLNNYRGEIVPSVHPEKIKRNGLMIDNPRAGSQIVQKGKPVFNIKSYTLGFTNLTFIVDKAKAASYISKYVTKDMVDLKGKKRFWYSRDLNKPEIEYNYDIDKLSKTEIYDNEHFTIFHSDDKVK